MARKQKTARQMMTEKTGDCYVIEIGLDSDISPRFDGTYPYLMSLVKVDDFEKPTTLPAPAWFTGLNKGDRFVFRVFVYGVTEEGLTDIVVNGLFARFLAPDNPKAAALCTNQDMICTGKDYYPDPEPATPSSARTGAKGWRFLDENGDEKSFTFIKGGRPRLHVSVAATFPNSEMKELRWYTHDPEIFVGEGGPPPHQGLSVPRRR